MRKPPQANMKLSLDHVMLFHKILANESKNHSPNLYSVYMLHSVFFKFIFSNRKKQPTINYVSKF